VNCRKEDGPGPRPSVARRRLSRDERHGSSRPPQRKGRLGYPFHPDQPSRGLDALAQEIRLHLDHGLVQEALKKIADKFASPDHMGPRFVAGFDDIQDEEERTIRMRDAYKRVSHLLELIDL
jgi:hypothetical protein